MVTNCIIVELTPPRRDLDSWGGGGCLRVVVLSMLQENHQKAFTQAQNHRASMTSKTEKPRKLISFSALQSCTKGILRKR